MKFHVTWNVVEQWSADIEADSWHEAFEKAPSDLRRIMHTRRVEGLQAEQTDWEATADA